MTDYPIIFSAPMILALLDGRKTMTRRLAWHKEVWPSPWQKRIAGDRLWVRESFFLADAYLEAKKFTGGCYRADETNELAIKHTGWRPSIHMPRWASRLTLIVTATKIERLQDISDEDADAEGCEVSPEEVTYWWDGYDTRIRDRDGNAGSVSQCAVGKYENAPPEWMEVKRRSKHTRPAVQACSRFETLWDVLHGADAWNTNPEVVALSFSVHRCNIDALGKEGATRERP